MKTLNLSGTPHTIGVGHGEQAKEEVHFSLDSYEKLFWYEAGLDWKQATESAKQHIDYIEDMNVDLLEEMDGIAKGAAVEFEDILTLNARSEIALTNNKHDGCTSLAVMPPLADNVYLAQNWDWRAAQSKSLFIADIKQSSNPGITMVTEGGIIGKIGMNSEGLGVCLNALRANVKSDRLPVHLALREILNSADIKEAKHKVGNGQSASSANYLIAQHNGENKKAINIEASPLGEDNIETHSRYVYHTNHFCSDFLTDKIGLDNINVTKGSFTRKQRIGELLNHAETHGEVVDQDIIKQWLSDHENVPDSICKHKDKGSSDYTNTISAFAIIMDLSNRHIHFRNGNPCQPNEIMNLQQ
ncbi:MAG TPA: C45 family peptidase [Virgibacillus sp.]|nr:C45 family peptidase [Virgibacillus sp.]